MSDSLSGQEVPASDLPDSENLSGQEVPESDMPQTDSGEEVPPEDMPTDYSSPGQQAATIAEGGAKGATAGLSTGFETKSASEIPFPSGPIGIAARMAKKVIGEVPAEDIIARQQQNPIEALGSEIVGNIVLGSMAPEIGAVGRWSKLGASALKTGLSTGVFQTGDEVSDGLLGIGNPAPAAALHILGATGLGTLMGPISSVASKSLSPLSNAKAGTAMKSFMTGLGYAADAPGQGITKLEDAIATKLPFSTEETEKLSPTAFKLGQMAFKGKMAGLGAVLGHAVTGTTGGYLEGPVVMQGINKAIEPYVNKASQQYLAPMFMRAAASGAIDKTSQLLDSATCIGKGQKAVEKGIEGLFSSGPQKVYDQTTSDQEREKLREFIENGGVDRQIQKEAQQSTLQGYAEGGEVQALPPMSNPIADQFPEHNVILNSAKTRISNHLNSVRPLPINQLPFDNEHKDPNKEREYNKVLDMAQRPLNILNKIKAGTLIPKDMQHFTAMYPEVHEHLKNEISKRLVDSKLDKEKKPPYHVRQSMSLFLGSDLDSSLTPASVMAAQNVFAQQKAQKNPPPNSKSSLSKIGKQAQTPEQARSERQNKD